MSAPSLIATLGVNITNFERGMHKAKDVAREVGSEIGSEIQNRLIAAFGVAAIEEFGRRTIETMMKIKDASQQLEITTDEVQKLDVAAKKVGLTFDDFGSALSKMGGARKDAVQSNLELRETFRKFGVSIDELNDPALRNIDILQKMAVAFRALDLNASDRQSLRDIFGKGGDRLLAAMRELKSISDAGLFREQDINAIQMMAEQLKESERHLMVMASKWMPALIIGAINFASALIKGSDVNERRSRAQELYKHYTSEKGYNQEGARLAAGFLNSQMGLSDTEQAQMFGQLEDYATGSASGLNRGPISGYKRKFPSERESRASADNPRARDSGAFFGPPAKGMDNSLYQREFETKTLSQAADFWDKLFHTQQEMQFKKMNPLQQQRELERRAKVEEVAASEYAGSTDERDQLAYAKHKSQAQDFRSQLQDLLMGQKNTTTFDSLSRIGGFNAFSGLGNQGLSVQERIARASETTARNTEPTQTPGGKKADTL